MSGEALRTPPHGEGLALVSIEMLERPLVSIHDGASIKVLAVAEDPAGGPKTPVGYVSTKSGRSQRLGEFSGKPTGKHMPCNAVMGWVGENRVYDKTVSTDMPLSGLWTAVAKLRATRAVKARLR